MISCKLTLLLLPMLFLAMVTAQAEGEGNEGGTTNLSSLSCEDERVQKNWTQEEFDACVNLKKGVADLAKGMGNALGGLGKAAVGFATWIIVVIVIAVVCCCGIPIGITIWCCCCKDKRGTGGNV